MAYAEKCRKSPRPWRVKYKLPNGKEDSESGFATKAAALAWGRDEEAKIRDGRWTDRKAGEITVGEWADRWLPLQDVGISTEVNREYLLRRFIRPAWGDRTLVSLTGAEITEWEIDLPATEGISRRTAQDARSLLCTILGDAAAARPPLIPYNPAVRPRNRDRKTGRRLMRSPPRIWATPLQTLLVAERAALLSGRDDDFVLVITIGYTGMRWGETIGLEREHLHSDLINVEWQLRELGGRFHRLPPKDDSYRSTNWEPQLPVDLPPFLAALLADQARKHPQDRCACRSQHGGSGRYLFTGRDGGHYQRGHYARRVFRPGLRRTVRANERTARQARHRGCQDLARRPGRSLACRAARAGLRRACGPGRRPADQHRWKAALPTLRARGRRAWGRSRRRTQNGRYPLPRQRGAARRRSATDQLAAGQDRAHTARAQAQRQDLDGRGRDPGDPLSEQRLGHEVPGMRGLYAHVSERMRRELTEALQRRWEESLRARAAYGPHSPVQLLDDLLVHYREAQREKLISQIQRLPHQSGRVILIR